MARHIRSRTARHDRFIAAYIMRKNKEVYAEAKQFYDDLDKKYPEKRDLTKTDEFLQQTTGYTSFYQRSRAKYQIQKQKHNNNQKIKGMSLEIPLMDKGDVEITVMAEKVDESLAIPDHIYNNLLAEISKDPVMSSIFDTIDQGQPQEQQQQQQEIDEILDELDDILPKQSSLEDEFEHLVCE